MTCLRNALVALVLGPVMVSGADPSFYQGRVAPILEQHCVACHGAEKSKGGLRLDSFAALLKGGEQGEVVVAGQPTQSELHRRITLPHGDEELMPSDGKPPLSAEEISVIRLWIAAGASPTQAVADFPDAPAMRRPTPPSAPLAPDWRPFAAEIERIARASGIKIVPRSLVPTDGLVVRTASSPSRCNDASLSQLKPIGPLIVDAELARTNITDAGLASLAEWVNLRSVDLSQTTVTTRGVAHLSTLSRLEKLNLSLTEVDEAALANLKSLPALSKVWLFGTKIDGEENQPKETNPR